MCPHVRMKSLCQQCNEPCHGFAFTFKARASLKTIQGGSLTVPCPAYVIILPFVHCTCFAFVFNLFYFWLCWVFVAASRPSLVAVSGGYSSLRCVGFSSRWLLLLRSTGSRHMGFSSCGTRASVVVARGLQSAGSVVVAHGLSCSAACGIFLDQGLNPCPLHWQEDS